MTLLETLIENTQDLKAEFLVKTERWAIKHFENSERIMSMNGAQWCKYFGLTPEHGRELPSGFYNTKNARTQDNMKNTASRIIKLGLEKYIAKEKDDAVRHYENSLEKLVYRLNKKGINDNDTLSVVSGCVGLNFEITLKAKDIIAKAWTIIAEGPVQRPHYRYLVK